MLYQSVMKIPEKLLKIKNDISQMKTVNELIDYISNTGIEKCAYILLQIWIITPIFVMIRSVYINIFFKSISEIAKRSDHSILWFTLLQQVGFLGCIVGLIVFSKSIMNAKFGHVRAVKYLRNNIFTILLSLMLFWSVLSCIASDYQIQSFWGDLVRHDGLLTYFAYAGIFCCGIVIKQKALVIRILKSFILVSTLLSILVLTNYTTLFRFLRITSTSSIFYNSNHFGYYLCLSVMCCFYLICNNDIMEKHHTGFWSFSFSILVLALLQNKSLGPYLAVIIGLLSLTILVFVKHKTHTVHALIGLIIFFTISITYNLFSRYLSTDLMILINDVKSIVDESPQADSAGSERWPLWINGLKFILEKPVFGYGPDNLGARYFAVGITKDRPHNEFIQIAASLGIPALLFYLSALVVHFLRFIQKHKSLSLMTGGAFCTLLSYLVSSFFGNTMYYTTPYLFMILGLSYGMLNKETILYTDTD